MPRFPNSTIVWTRHRALFYATLGLTVGLVDTLFAVWLGVEFRLGSRDVTVYVGGYVSLSFAVLGFLLGHSLEAREREMRSAHTIQTQTEQLAGARERIAQTEKLASLGQLASAIAHEVRNPLAILRSSAQNAAEGSSSDEMRESCQFMIEEIDRLDRVTRVILGFVRPFQLSRTSVPAAFVFGRVALLASKLFEDAAVPLHIAQDPRGASAIIHVDVDLLCQLFLGLLRNASQASPPGMPVELCLAPPSTTHIAFVVRDHGEGVRAELREKVFEPFFTTRAEGNGLGLAVAKQIVVAHGGSICVEDHPSGGAQFVVQLPCASETVRSTT